MYQTAKAQRSANAERCDLPDVCKRLFMLSQHSNASR